MNEEFQIGEQVSIKAHGVTGVVNGIFIGRQGKQFNVEYRTNEGVICDRYFVAAEIERV